MAVLEVYLYIRNCNILYQMYVFGIPIKYQEVD